jgi:hypothetical protein
LASPRPSFLQASLLQKPGVAFSLQGSGLTLVPARPQGFVFGLPQSAQKAPAAKAAVMTIAIKRAG